MDIVNEMVQSQTKSGVAGALVECVKACLRCAHACSACADACLAEKNLEGLRRCIRLNLDCADVCDATGRVLARLSNGDAEITRTLLVACERACVACGAECAVHAGHHDHCQRCAEECRRCAEACRSALAS